MISQMKRRTDQIRRFWWVVLVITALATTGAAVHALTARPSYQATSTLVQSAPGLTPDQNATMAVGYATLFNEPETIGRLKATHGLPEDVTFEARTVASSPILIIEATAGEPRVAQDAAQTMAEAFRDDINAVRHGEYDKAITNTENELESLMSQREPDGSMNPLVPVVQTRLDSMRGDATNQLEDLQPRAGVTTTDQSILFQLGQGILGGLLLGILAALGLATVSPRLANASELREKTGIDPLVDVPAGGSITSDKAREERLRTLANLLSLQDLPKSSVVALTDCRGSRGARGIAEAIARLSAQKGDRTVLVYANNDPKQQKDGVGFNDALANSSLVTSSLKDCAVEALKVLPVGSVGIDRYSLMSRARIDAVLDQLRLSADLIVVVAPPISDTIDSQPICAAANFTMLVIDKRTSRRGDVKSAAEALNGAHAVLLGAVMTEGDKTEKSVSAPAWPATVDGNGEAVSAQTLASNWSGSS